ncbi:zinc transporter ZupT [compost metagenome]
MAFFDLLPEAQELTSRNIFPWVLGSFIAFYFLENLLHYHSHHHVGHHHPMGLVAFLGMTFHSLIDGIIIGVGFEVSPALGFVTTMGLLAHELPQGIAVTSILLHAGYSKGRAIAYAGLVALATPVGAVGTSLVTRGLQPESVGILLAIASGSFLYVAASDLIPESHAAKHALTGVLLLLGVAFVYGIVQLFHAH